MIQSVKSKNPVGIKRR